MIGWEVLPTENYANSLDLTMQINSIYRKQNLFQEMKTNFLGFWKISMDRLVNVKSDLIIVTMSGRGFRFSRRAQ